MEAVGDNGFSEVQEVTTNHEEPEWQENLYNEQDYYAVKALHVKAEPIGSFVVKATAISVLY